LVFFSKVDELSDLVGFWQAFNQACGKFMVIRLNLEPKKLKFAKKPSRSKKYKGLALNRDFYRLAAALANPEFTDLPSADRQAIRKSLSTRTDGS
jgi:hypothetical protein